MHKRGQLSYAADHRRVTSRIWINSSGPLAGDRKRGGEGKRVEFGGGRIIKKKKRRYRMLETPQSTNAKQNQNGGKLGRQRFMRRWFESRRNGQTSYRSCMLMPSETGSV